MKALNYGLWKGTLNGNQICLNLENMGNHERQTRHICFSKTEINGLSERADQEFYIKKEQGSTVENVLKDIISKKPQDSTKVDSTKSTEKVIKNVLGGLLGNKKKQKDTVK